MVNKKIQREITWIPIRFFIVLILPLLFFYILILPSYSNLDKIKIGNGYRFVVVEEKPNFLTPLKNIYKYSFEILDYEFCFKNIGSTIKIIYTNGIEEKVFIDDNLKTTLTITVGGKNISEEILRNIKRCRQVNLNELSRIEWTFSTTFTADEPSQVVYTEQIPNWEESLRPEKWSKRTFCFLFLLSWWAFIWLVTRMIYFVRWGINKKSS